MKIYISGSLAYDRIMDFPGHFADHILPHKIHVLNVCFNISGLVEKFGGTAANIAYSLSLLGESAEIVATAGDDFDRYHQWLEHNGLPSNWIKRIPGVLTAGAYITTDLDDNQITAFNPGAMAFDADLPALDGDGQRTLVFVAPGNKNDMLALTNRSRESGIKFLFDPGQSLNIWQGEELREAVRGALCFISNEYELTLFLKMTGWHLDAFRREVQAVITTQGPEGCILDLCGERTLIPAVPVTRVCDPTGAGDAFRGGLLKGLAMGQDWLTCCQIGSVTAAYAVEQYGTQEHRFGWSDFQERFEKHFGPLQSAVEP